MNNSGFSCGLLVGLLQERPFPPKKILAVLRGGGVTLFFFSYVKPV